MVSRSAKSSSVCIVELFRNTQFIYELELARLELGGLGAKVNTNGDLRHIQVHDIEPSILKERVAYFERVEGERTNYAVLTSFNRTRSPNQFLTHWMYPYKGKFHPQMIRALFNIMGLKSGSVVLDPFSGSGTAALESSLLGLDFVGYDVSPLCVLQAQVKTQSHQALPAIAQECKRVVSSAERTLFDDADTPLEEVISSVADEKARHFFRLAWLLAHGDVARRGRKFAASFAKNVEAMLASACDHETALQQLQLRPGAASVELGDARRLPLANASVDAVVTSPPYSIALDYVANDAHALSALGCDLEQLRESFIGVRGAGKKRLDLFNEDLEQSICEMARVLKPGGWCAIIVGNSTHQGAEVPTVEKTRQFAQQHGLKLEEEIVKTIFGLYNIMQSENVLLFRK